MPYEHELNHKIWMSYHDIIAKLGLPIGEAVTAFMKEGLYTQPPNKYDYHFPTEYAKSGDFSNQPFVIEVITRDGTSVFRWNYPRLRQLILHETMTLMAAGSELPDLRDW